MNQTMRYTVHAIHDVAEAIWVGGNVFGVIAANPAARRAGNHSDIGAVTNQAWENFTPLGISSALALGASWASMRISDPRFSRPEFRTLTLTHDVLVGSVLALTVIGGVLNRSIAESVPADRTPMQDGLTPVAETPEPAKSSLLAMRVVAASNLLVGGALSVTGAILEQKLMDQGPVSRALLPLEQLGRGAGVAVEAVKGLAAAELIRRGGRMVGESMGLVQPEPKSRIQRLGESANTLWRERVLRSAA